MSNGTIKLSTEELSFFAHFVADRMSKNEHRTRSLNHVIERAVHAVNRRREERAAEILGIVAKRSDGQSFCEPVGPGAFQKTLDNLKAGGRPNVDLRIRAVELAAQARGGLAVESVIAEADKLYRYITLGHIDSRGSE